MEQEVILTINGKSHKLSKPQYPGGGRKHEVVCPKCSLFKSHFDFCWKSYGTFMPLCSILAKTNCWDNDFMTYFQEYKIKTIKQTT